MASEDFINLGSASGTEAAELDNQTLEPTEVHSDEGSPDSDNLEKLEPYGRENDQQLLQSVVHDDDFIHQSSVLEECVELTESVMVVESVGIVEPGHTENGCTDFSAVNNHMVEQEQSSMTGVKRSRITSDERPSVHVVYKSLTRASRKKLEELLQQWSEWHPQNEASSDMSANEAIEILEIQNGVLQHEIADLREQLRTLRATLAGYEAQGGAGTSSSAPPRDGVPSDFAAQLQEAMERAEIRERELLEQRKELDEALARIIHIDHVRIAAEEARDRAIRDRLAADAERERLEQRLAGLRTDDFWQGKIDRLKEEAREARAEARTADLRYHQLWDRVRRKGERVAQRLQGLGGSTPMAGGQGRSLGSTFGDLRSLECYGLGVEGLGAPSTGALPERSVTSRLPPRGGRGGDQGDREKGK